MQERGFLFSWVGKGTTSVVPILLRLIRLQPLRSCPPEQSSANVGESVVSCCLHQNLSSQSQSRSLAAPVSCAFATGEETPNANWIGAYAGIMSLSEQVSSLRDEITALHNMNLLYSRRGEHSPVERTASEVRASRLAQIKLELSKMRNRPDDTAVWWGKSRTPNHIA